MTRVKNTIVGLSVLAWMLAWGNVAWTAPLVFDAQLTSAIATCAVSGDSTNVVAVGSGEQGA